MGLSTLVNRPQQVDRCIFQTRPAGDSRWTDGCFYLGWHIAAGGQEGLSIVTGWLQLVLVMLSFHQLSACAVQAASSPGPHRASWVAAYGYSDG